MEIFGIGLHILIAIFFAVHAIRRGRELYWVMLLFFFPLLGSLVYFFAIYLPELRQSRGAYVAGKAVREVVDPEPKCRFADWLVKQDSPADRQRARALYEDIVSDAKHWHSHARSLNREWLRRAKEGLSA